jgi:hypothetical protein
MKVKVTAEIHLNIPGEFQDDQLAVKLIDDTLRDMLYVGVDYDEEDLPEDFLPIKELTISSYEVLAGRVTQDDLDKALEKQRQNY